MEIGYGTLEDVLFRMFGLRPKQRGALVGRLKYFARLGFPQAAKVGRGVRARYGAEDVIQLALALEITDLGVAPVPIVERIVRDADLIRAAVAKAWRGSGSPGPERVRWSVNLAVLAGMGTDGAGAASAVPLIEEIAPAALVAEPEPDRDLPFDERRSAAGRRARIVLDPGLFLRDLENAFGETDPGLAPMFVDALGEIVLAERGRVTTPASAGRARRAGASR
jgi:hypothetical protein